MGRIQCQRQNRKCPLFLEIGPCEVLIFAPYPSRTTSELAGRYSRVSESADAGHREEPHGLPQENGLQEHAEDMRKAINNCSTEIVKDHPDYVVRVVSDEGQIGRGYLDRFMDVETLVPTVVTTSQMLTTGVDVPTCRNIVLARVINSMTDFKQIIGRGTRVRDDYGKLFFNIVDYTGSASRLFADPEFDGEPTLIDEELIDEHGEVVE